MKQWKKNGAFRARVRVERRPRCACGSLNVEKHARRGEPRSFDVRCLACNTSFVWRDDSEPEMLGVPVPVGRR